ncbi:MAG TPA: aminotransferase class I/II-fold pyridoxal phosphate-dependent enzyme [Bacteroidales bacterium]|nr:aminotransferase class I/II-fold pyridoxal phosphate-dependent enzyme [Bacteroidales bacterium]
MKPKIWLSSPHMGTMESVYVQEAFDTNWIAPLGPHVNGFETDLQAFTGTGHAAALSSGTAALHLALILLGVKAGDEVICQSFTFSASANPIVYQGATPVFVDSERDTWNIHPEYLKDAIIDRIARGKKPKAIIAVDLYGMPAKMSEITEIAKQYDIPLIEDAAEALGSHIGGKMCGTFGKLNILSFNGNKIITTSGGGALLSEDGELIARARFLATQARDNAPHYQHSHIGYNYRMSNVVAAIGRGQMQVLPARVAARRANFDRYQKLLGEINAKGYRIELLPEPEGFFSNRWLSTVIIDPENNNGITREDLRLAFEAENIESRPLWKPMHLQPVFADAPFYGEEVSERLFIDGLCLPSGSNLKQEDWKRIEAVFFSVFP